MFNGNKLKTISDRLRFLVDERLPKRGRFQHLENLSKIKAHRWKNFFYKTQNASKDMVDFWSEKYPDDAVWLSTGEGSVNALAFPFANSPPSKNQHKAIVDRFIWVVTEFASSKGEQLFSYLEERSRHAILAADWAEVIIKKVPPSAEMLRIICSARPMFTEWVIRGSVSNLQVDPTDMDSVARWDKLENEMFDGLADEIKRRKQDKPT